MEDLNLSETEMRYFGDLFLCCDEESNGKIPILKATELFRSSNIPNDVLKQIMDISVAPNNYMALNHMNRKQFYSSLKLIAAHQQNIALKPDLLSTALDLPLPRFTWALNSEANADLIQLSNSPKEQHIPKRERNFTSSVGAYEPIRVTNLSDNEMPGPLSHDNNEALSTDSEIESETASHNHRRGKNGSPWSTASESPTPTNSVAERPHPMWEHSATGRGVWPVNTGEEHTQLLGTEEESSDRHSSEEETEPHEDMWAISSAQARHYAVQFTQLRPDRGLLSGHVARLFFEKSRLSVPDLRKIWQLSDMNKDGALSLEEFGIAMHLIVLRRNNVAVPDTVPERLLRAARRLRGPAEGDAPDAPEAHHAGKEWTRFVESPAASIASPGPKPVNFDFHKSAVERDPKIYHPVALRVTPDAGEGEPRRSPPSPKRTEPNGGEIRPLQRPQPKRPAVAAAAAPGALPPPPARDHDDGPMSLQGRKEPPPPPPPRPLRQHARSSSLDLTRLGNAPPPPPRASPPHAARPALAPQRSEGARDYEPEGFGYWRADAPRMQGAFELVRARTQPDATPDVRALSDQNAVLHRVCRALCAELADVTREREQLRHRLAAALPSHPAQPPQ